VIGSYMDASSPAIDQSGFLYLGDVKGVLHKFQDNVTFTTRLWKVQIGTKITASPVIGSDGTIYVGSTNGLSAVRPTDGKVLWNFPAGIVDQTPALGSDDTVYFGVKSGQTRAIYAIARDGTLRWQYGPVPAASPYGGFPTVGADGIVYVGFGTGVYAFSPDGVSIWTYDTGNVVSSFPVIAGTASKQTGGNAVIYVASSDWKLHAISSPRHGSDTNDPPLASAGPDQTATVGHVVGFNGSASDQNPDVLSFTWDFGDGKSAFGLTAHHAYVTAGTYTATLTVSDGFSATTDALTVTVAPSGGTLAFSDTFDRADSPSPGNGWQEAQGDLGIKGNELRNAALKDTHIAIQPALSGLTHARQRRSPRSTTTPCPISGVVLRFQDPNNYYLLYRQMGGTSQLRISRIMNGIETVLVSAGTPQPALNTFFRLAADATGNKADTQALRRDRHVDGNHVQQRRANADRHGFHAGRRAVSGSCSARERARHSSIAWTSSRRRCSDRELNSHLPVRRPRPCAIVRDGECSTRAAGRGGRCVIRPRQAAPWPGSSPKKPVMRERRPSDASPPTSMPAAATAPSGPRSSQAKRTWSWCTSTPLVR
jgi:PKD repeat protein